MAGLDTVESLQSTTEYLDTNKDYSDLSEDEINLIISSMPETVAASGAINTGRKSSKRCA